MFISDNTGSAFMSYCGDGKSSKKIVDALTIGYGIPSNPFSKPAKSNPLSGLEKSPEVLYNTTFPLPMAF
jgi:hypothetical protein